MIARGLALGIAIAIAASLPAPAVAAETICGWIQNPVPREYMLTDSRGTFVIMSQADKEGAEPAGMDRIGDLSAKENIGGGRTACACLKGDIAGKRIVAIYGFTQKTLAACRADRKLPLPPD